ncbi:MAG: alpha-L-fucosidase [Candidatus Sumerlaeota bacterium]|nr:alpha-L-fucosidase [Candidatus Sumerlaeota bacterium]
MNRATLLTLAGLTMFAESAGAGGAAAPDQPYQPTWNSLKNWRTPQWLRDGKFGIYTHWGVYSVPAQGPNGTWFANRLYSNANGPERKFHEATYGPLEKFGYKDFIPMFSGEKFNADEWAELFQKAGARFAGPVAEHHDGFAMWDTKYSEWNAAKMGPKRDVVGELAKAIKKRDMKFVTAFHHAESWFYFPTWDKRYDCGDPRYSGLYGPIHEKGASPDKAFLDDWKGRIIEVIDKYDPDFLWFDYGLKQITDSYQQDALAYYYNQAAVRCKEVVVSYKFHDLPPGAGLLDLELGQETDLTYYDWITDTTVDNGSAWGYVKGQGFKTLENLIVNLVDRVSKNGYLLLNVGPKPDGTIPDEAKALLLGMGAWLKINGEAIYGTTPWRLAGEGPTQLTTKTKEKKGKNFNENNELRYIAQDIRFTVNGAALYATVLAWPGEKVLIKSFAPKYNWPGIYPSEIVSITMLGDGKELKWTMTKEGLSIETPKTKPCEHAFVFKIARKCPF